MAYVAKVPMFIGGVEYKPGDVIHAMDYATEVAGLRSGDIELTDKAPVAPKPKANAAAKKAVKKPRKKSTARKSTTKAPAAQKAEIVDKTNANKAAAKESSAKPTVK